jgi:glucose/arabinose dehydrogenase/mono/diheme cytochrome c family protein
MIDSARAGMRAIRMIALLLVIASGTGSSAWAGDRKPPTQCATGNSGITLSPGFCATVFADNIGHARHLVVAPNGVVYVNTWSGVYYDNDKPPTGGFLVALQDTNGDGRAELNERFGDGVTQGSAGGTGIAIYNGALYAEQNDRIIRYELKPGSVVPKGAPEVVVSGMPLTGDHPMHPFVIDSKGSLFVDLGSATNTCEEKNRMPGSVGLKPCREQETRAGIWRYDANKTGQKFSPAERYATGIRNGEGMSFDSAGRLYVTQHGRDQLSENWPALYHPEQGRELPAEEVVLLQEGGDYGWPQCYFDGAQKKLVLAPEYGGDGGKTTGTCANKQAPVAFFPAHWAPNDLLIYTGHQFPQPYRGGAFIAFHGSWNRAPAPQGGYNVVYQPMDGAKASGNYVVFADGFAGVEKAPGRATFRPSGLAAGPDGAVYISDDVKGRIWRVTYSAERAATRIDSAPAPKVAASTSLGAAVPPEGVHPDAGRTALPVPQGSTAEQVALGDRIFHGKAAGGTCTGCHASDAKGTSLGPNLTSGKWLWSDGSLKALTETITKGVPVPKQSLGAMPPMGGAQLSKDEASALAAYVWAIGHNPK